MKHISFTYFSDSKEQNICYYPKENQYPFYNTYLLFLKQRQYNQIKQKKPVLKTQAIIPHINSEKNSPPTITKVVCDNLTQFCQTSFSVATLGTFWSIVDRENSIYICQRCHSWIWENCLNNSCKIIFRNSR